MGLGSTCLIRHILELLGDDVPPEDDNIPSTPNRYIQMWNALRKPGNTKPVLQIIKNYPGNGSYLLCFALKVCLGRGHLDDLLELIAANEDGIGYPLAWKGSEMLSVAVSTGNLATLMDARVHPSFITFEQLSGFTKHRLQAHDLIKGFVSIIDAAPEHIRTKWLDMNFWTFVGRPSRTRSCVIYDLVKSVMAGSLRRLLVFSYVHPFELGVIDFCWEFLITSGKYDFLFCNLLPDIQDAQRAAILCPTSPRSLRGIESEVG